MSLPLLPEGLTVEDVDFTKTDGLVPGVVQHASTGQVLMVGFLDEQALRTTLATGLATFYSRSRGAQWTKGESSGNTLTVRAVEVDCDRDTVLLHAIPAGPTCHTGDQTCFGPDALAPGGTWASDGALASSGPAVAGGAALGGAAVPGGAAKATARGAFLAQLDEVVRGRHEARPEGSYTTRLFEGGVRRIAQKVGEEGVETALAAVAQEDDDLLGESADLIYHLLVLLRSRGLGLDQVEDVLRERHGQQPG